MKKLWSLSVLLLCAVVAMAQFAHISMAEASNCDTVKTEQHATAPADAQADGHTKNAAKEFCCEACHLHMVSLPLTAAETAAPVSERIASLPVAVSDIAPTTLSEPPQA